MSASVSEIAISVEPSRQMPGRLVSLDFFRGATIAFMIVVNSQTNEEAYWPLRHASWNGWTPTDLVFPFFLFIVGVSLVLSFETRLAQGFSKSTLMLRALRRGAILFAIGLALNGLGSLSLEHWRIPGVLQRIAVAYCAAVAITLYSGTRARVVWIAGLLVGYWIVMRFVPVPGFGVPGRNIPLLHPDANLAAYLDRKLMLGHLWERTRDPEGILSTFPAIATALCGVLTGEWLRSERARRQGSAGMVLTGVAAIVAGELWGIWFPINKKLWTSSYVVFTAGCALVCLAMCYWLIDIKLHRGWWTKPFLIFGSNAITAYVISELLGGFLSWKGYVFFRSVGSPAVESLLHSLTVLGICFLPVWWMYRKKVLLRI